MDTAILRARYAQLACEITGCSGVQRARAKLYAHCSSMASLRMFSENIGVYIPLSVENYSIARDIIIQALFN